MLIIEVLNKIKAPLIRLGSRFTVQELFSSNISPQIQPFIKICKGKIRYGIKDKSYKTTYIDDKDRNEINKLSVIIMHF